jgi:hypothetical protein
MILAGEVLEFAVKLGESLAKVNESACSKLGIENVPMRKIGKSSVIAKELSDYRELRLICLQEKPVTYGILGEKGDLKFIVDKLFLDLAPKDGNNALNHTVGLYGIEEEVYKDMLSRVRKIHRKYKYVEVRLKESAV